MKQSHCLNIVLVLLTLVFLPACTAAPSPAARYLTLLDDNITATRSQIPAMTQSAQKAAKRLIDGGRIWVAGPQHGFQIETFNRAGGLMTLTQLKDKTPGADDVVLYGAAALTDEDVEAIKTWHDSGTQVVAFSRGQAPATVFTNGVTTGMSVRDGNVTKILPVDTLMNAVNMWAWTAELTAAATRQGQMLCFYESYGMPNGRKWGTKYSGKTIQDDVTVEPIAAGEMGNQYLDYVQNCIHQIRSSAQPIFTKAGEQWRDAGSDAYCATIGHMFPSHFQDKRAPQMITFENSPPDDSAFVFDVGYQLAPTKNIKHAMEQGYDLLYISIAPGEQTAANFTHFDPKWPLPDACIKVEGYPIPILPASGVVNAAIYWSLLAEVCAIQTP